MLYYTKTVRQTLKELATSESGLTDSEVEKRRKKYGSNDIKMASEPLWRKLIEPFANVFMLVLCIAALVSIFDHAMLDAAIVIAIMAASAIIYYVQRFSTDRILRSLQKHEALSVEVFRNNTLVKIDSSHLVPGDVITLTEGEKIPADARLLTARSLRIDESQLTGESAPISKQTDVLTGKKEVYEQSNMLFQGSFIVAGEATAIIVTTGNNTEFGHLAMLTKNTSVQSPVQKKIDKLLSQVIGVVGGIALVAFGLSMLRGMDVAESLRFVIALSVSAVPESLPVAITVVLVLGMRRMAAKKALIRTMRSIETIGVITTIATDKTGTLTQNRLTVHETWQPHNVRSDLVKIITRAINQTSHNVHDPLDTALSDFAQLKRSVQPSQPPLSNLPFDQAVSMSGNVWHNGDKYDLIVKGAPEHVLARCDLTENEHEESNVALHTLTASGYRVIAIAHRSMPHSISRFSQLTRKDLLTFDGFVAVADILRPEAKKAVQAALNAGISVRMITGDHFETAYYIGHQLGMVKTRSEVFDSRRMDVMTNEELEEVIGDIHVFSRVIPEHKYRILALLKKNNITAMTGDGVNDVPALANAHVGVAMGSGSSIAKDAGDIILIDDNFKSIIDAMQEGRTIFANIRRMLFYLLSTNAGEVLTMLGALAIGLPIPLVPVQILWVNLVTDTAMVIPLGLEPSEKLHMNRKPNSPDAPILGKLLISRMILVAISMAVLTLSLYALYSSAYGHEYGQTIAFSALVVMQWANAISARSDDESLFMRMRILNGKFYAGLALAVTLQLFAIFGPLGNLLHVTRVTVGDLIVTGTIAFLVPIILVEIHKFIGRRFYHRGS
jgi:Ca2+-transporting ATPase